MLTALMIVSFVVLLNITKLKTGSYNNSLSYYLVFWVGWLLLSFLDPFGLYSVSDYTYLILWINIFCFSVGYLLFCKRSSPKGYQSFCISSGSKHALLVAQLFVLLILANYYLQYNQLLAEMTINDARLIRYEQGFLFKSASEYFIYTYFLTSIMVISLVISIGRYVVTSQIDLFIVLSLINAILFGLTGLGRFVFFNTIVFLAIAVAFRKNDIQAKQYKAYGQNNRNIFKYFFICFGIVGFMVVLTGLRTGIAVSGVKEFFDLFAYSIEQGITYFIGPFRAFDSFLNFKIYDSIGHTFGRATFAGIDELFNNFAIIIGLNYTSANELMSSFTVDNIAIGQYHQFNAFYTGTMNFYLDGGVAGVIILAFLYGATAAMVWNRYQKAPNLFNYSLLIYFTHTTIASEYRLEFAAPTTWVIIVVLVICSQWVRNKKLAD